MELVKYLWVVIRFQICIFDILNTAVSIKRKIFDAL